MNLVNNVKEYIVENFLFGDDEKLDQQTPLFESGILDSTGVMELICFIEEAYNIIIEDEDLTHENFFNLDCINVLLNKKLKITAE